MIWSFDDIPVGHWEGIQGGPDKKINENIPCCAGPINDLPSIKEWISGETEQNTSESATGVLLEIKE